MSKTPRTPLWRFSLRALFALMAVICIVAAVARTHYRNVQRINEIERCIEQAGSTSLCPELYSRCLLHLREDFNMRVFLHADRPSPRFLEWLERASVQIDERRQQRVEFVCVMRGPREGPVDWALIRQGIDCFRPDKVQFYGFKNAVPRELLDRLSCPVIDLGSPYLTVDGEVTLTCDQICLREGAADFWPHVSPLSTVQMVDATFSTKAELLSFQAIPSLTEVHFDFNYELTAADIRELMSHLPGVQIHLTCWGPSEVEQTKLTRDFAPYLHLEVIGVYGPGTVISAD